MFFLSSRSAHGITSSSAIDGDSVSLEPDSLEPVPVAAGRAHQQQPTGAVQCMGSVWNRSPLPEETEVDGDEDEDARQVGECVDDKDEANRSVPWIEEPPPPPPEHVVEADEGDVTDEAPHPPDKLVEYAVEDGVHFLEDGHYWLEMPGLPPADDERPSVVETPARAITVRFSTDPIRGN